MSTSYETIIGLEVHAQLTTASKLFSGSATAFGADPNTQVNEVDLAMPGVLPVLNQAAVDMGIKFGLAVGADINDKSVFARKNYFYPDLPKGYQISQYELPIVTDGKVELDLEDGIVKTVRIQRMHLEEDAGKSIHDIGADAVSHVDLNRAGVPLMEIVTHPDLRSAEEAGAYLKKLRSILRFLGVCDGNMEEGSMRCDANVSIRPVGQTALNTRVEIKNLNSIRNVMRAIVHEAERQQEVLEAGGTITQETRLWNVDTASTRTMRSKEDAHDYRYFPDPDLLPVRVDAARIERARASMPELPDEKKARFMAEYGLGAYDAAVLTLSRVSADFYEAALGVKPCGREGGPTPDGADTGAAEGARPAAPAPKRAPKQVANWMTVELFGALNKMGRELTDSPVSPAQLGALVDLMENGTLSGKMAKDVFADMLETSRDPKVIVEEKGLVQITDRGALEKIVAEIVAANGDNVAKYKGGNERVFGFFVGQVMKATGGRANPAIVNELLKAALS